MSTSCPANAETAEVESPASLPIVVLHVLPELEDVLAAQETASAAALTT